MKELSKTELEVMKCIWNAGKPVGNKDILDEMNTVYNKAWKIQTLSTYLQKLLLKGYIRIYEHKLRRGNNYLYVPEISFDEYKAYQLSEFANFWETPVTYDFLSACSKSNGITKEELAVTCSNF